MIRVLITKLCSIPGRSLVVGMECELDDETGRLVIAAGCGAPVEATVSVPSAVEVIRAENPSTHPIRGEE